MPGPRKKNKSAPILSHEFIITNHGDIVSCVCMLFMFGLMFKSTQKLAGVFIAPQYNITKPSNDLFGLVTAIIVSLAAVGITRTDPANGCEGEYRFIDSNVPEVSLYTAGRKDICTVFFYSLAWIVIHAIIQEYILDKINRKFHMSKTKISRFNNMGGHIPFFFASAAWGADIILKENLLPKISNIWDGYPHTEMTFMVKFYFILQIAYWIHCFPELYFLKAKKEDIFPRIRVYLQYIACIIPAYIFNFTRLALVCLVIHYFVEFLLYTIKILNYMGKTEGSKNQLMVLWGVLYTIARVGIIMVAVATFLVGLPKQDSADDPLLIPNFNRKPVRIILLAGITLMQAWLVWQFISYQVHYWGEVFQTSDQKALKKKEQKKAQKKQTKEEQKKAHLENEKKEEEMPVSNGKYKTS